MKKTNEISQNTEQKIIEIATELFAQNGFDGTSTRDICKKAGVKEENITVVWSPGAFEIPVLAKKVAKSKAYDAIIALGAIIKGSTPHFDYVSAELSKGIASVSLETEIPVIFGVLTTENIEQAIERAGTKAGNKGSDAAKSAIEMANLIKLV